MRAVHRDQTIPGSHSAVTSLSWARCGTFDSGELTQIALLHNSGVWADCAIPLADVDEWAACVRLGFPIVRGCKMTAFVSERERRRTSLGHGGDRFRACHSSGGRFTWSRFPQRTVGSWSMTTTEGNEAEVTKHSRMVQHGWWSAQRPPVSVVINVGFILRSRDGYYARVRGGDDEVSDRHLSPTTLCTRG